MASYQPNWYMEYLDHAANPVGEIRGAHSRRFSFLLNRPGTIEFSLDTTNPDVGMILANEDTQNGVITLYRDGTLMMVAEVTAMALTGAEGDKSLQIQATDHFWTKLSKMLIASSMSTTGFKVTTTTAKGTLLVNALPANSQHDAANNADATVGTTSAIANVAGAGPYYYKPWLELVQEMAFTVSGFDFWTIPVVPTPGVGAYWNPPLSHIRFASLKGTDKSALVYFEYGEGTRSNVREYTWAWDKSNVISTAYVLPPDWPNNQGRAVATASSGGSDILHAGTRQEVIPSDLTNTDLREQLADEHIAIRKTPKQTFTFNPLAAGTDTSGRVPIFPDNFTTGDIITGRVVDYGITMLDADVRVYGVVCEVDDAGLETQSLQLSLDIT